MRWAKRLPLEELAPYLVELPPDPAGYRFDPAAVFGNDHPLEIEVGFGKGLFLLTASESCPDTNFLGIETERKLQLYVATRLAKRERHNVRVLKADARQFIRDHLADATVQAIHVFFPDPWWKKRHHKRRVFTPEFVDQCQRVLRAGGRLNLVTDVADYYEMVRALIADHPHLKPLPPPPEKPAEHDLDYLTNYERKFRKESRPIYRANYERS